VTAISAVVFDLDGTLVRYEGIEFESSWGAIAAAAEVAEQSLALLQKYMGRPEAYAQWVAQDAALLAGISVERVASRIFPAPYAAGVREAVEALRGRYRMGILSSGVDLVAEWARRDLGLEFALANHLEVTGGRFTGRSRTVVGLWEKAEALRALAGELGIPLQEICFVGDHVNDIPPMEIVGLAVAANPKDRRVREAAAHTISDFSELPEILVRAAG